MNDIMPPGAPPDEPDDQLSTDQQERLLGLVRDEVAPLLDQPAPPPRWVRLVALLGEIRRIAFNRSLSNDDIARGIRDAIREHDGEDFGD